MGDKMGDAAIYFPLILAPMPRIGIVPNYDDDDDKKRRRANLLRLFVKP